MRMVQNPFHLEPGRNVYIGENLSKYTFSDIEGVKRQDIAFYSTMPYLKNIRNAILSHTNMFIYKENLFEDKMLSPFNRKNARFYSYSIDSTFTEGQEARKKINIKPRIPHSQLVKGSFICNNEGQIIRFSLFFQYDHFLKIQINGHAGDSLLESLLVKQININAAYSFMGNKVNFQLNSIINYSKIDNTSQRMNTRNTEPVDIKINKDSSYLYFAQNRPIPLLKIEDSIYHIYSDKQEQKKDSLLTPTLKNKEKIWERAFFNTHNIRIGGSDLNLPAIITPSTFQWSQSKGLSLKTRIKWNALISDEKKVSIAPSIGYNVKQEQFYWNVPVKYSFSPSMNGNIQFSIGNGNHIYNSQQAKEVRKNLKGVVQYDSLLQIMKDFKFYYYKDFYSKLKMEITPLKGFEINTGLVYHRRAHIGWRKRYTTITNNQAQYYNSLAPSLEIKWTPSLKSSSDRNKLFVSSWPTFSTLYERGLRVFGKNGSCYERWEFDIQYQKQIAALQTLYSRIAAGFYSNQKNTYFVDYANFQYQSLPLDNDQELMGQFQLLDKRWYNESEYYAMFCSSYQTPMLALSRIPIFSKFIKKESLHFNSLIVNALKPYIEFGYGFKTSIVDLSVYSGFAHKGSFSLGTKISISLFDEL